ncbi:MAG: gfo/Idh/MocA family oxidoreductase, partial [Lentisphaerae bacterium]
GKLALLGMNQRLRRRLLTAARMLGEGVIGRIYYAKAWWLRQSPSPEMLIARKEWGMSRQLSGGGPLMDIGVHVLDKVLACLDFPEVSGVSAGLSTGIGKDIAHSYNLDYEVEDFVCGLIHCADGCRIHLEASFFHAFDGKETQGIMIHGENGYFDGENIFQRKPGSTEYHPVPLSPDETYPQSSEEHFVHILSGEAEPLATLEQGLAELQLIEALYRSADRNGQFEPLSS